MLSKIIQTEHVTLIMPDSKLSNLLTWLAKKNYMQLDVPSGYYMKKYSAGEVKTAIELQREFENDNL